MTPTPAGRIHERSVFRALRRPQGRASRGPVRAAYVPLAAGPEDPSAQVGYAIGRHCGNAVARNRLRRRLRAAVAEVAAEVPPGAYLLASRPEAGRVEFADLVTSVRQAMRAAGAPTPGTGR